jgi:hypothetical protein
MIRRASSETAKPASRPSTPPRTPSGGARLGPRRHERSDDANAFIPDPEGGPAHTSDDLAEILAEDFVQAATSGEDVAEGSGDEVVPEELGGPFIETSAGEEFAAGTDESNPADAEAEPLPLSGPGIVGTPKEELP